MKAKTQPRTKAKGPISNMPLPVVKIERRTYRVKEFCEAFRISRATIYHEINSGRLQMFKVGRRTLISAAAAEKWVQGLENEQGLGSGTR